MLRVEAESGASGIKIRARAQMQRLELQILTVPWCSKACGTQCALPRLRAKASANSQRVLAARDQHTSAVASTLSHVGGHDDYACRRAVLARTLAQC